MSDLFGNHIVGFPTRRLILKGSLGKQNLLGFWEHEAGPEETKVVDLICLGTTNNVCGHMTSK